MLLETSESIKMAPKHVAATIMLYSRAVAPLSFVMNVYIFFSPNTPHGCPISSLVNLQNTILDRIFSLICENDWLLTPTAS